MAETKLSASDSGLLYFGNNNAKLKDFPIATFSIPSGYTCPGAMDCMARFDRKKRKIVDGPRTKFRCFSASTEASFKTVRISTDRNWLLLKRAKAVERMTALILMSLPPSYYTMIRVHVSGDFYSQEYMMAWMEAARQQPDRLFYAYTKSLHFWVRIKNLVPPNFVFTASRGGRFDSLIGEHNLKEAVVVFHPDEAEVQGLVIDHDDSLARDPRVKRFALLLHNQSQPKGSEAAAAIQIMKNEKVKYNYSRKR